MDFLELGQLLRRERERKKLSVREVTEITKISRRNVEALERGLIDDLPHPVYTKGFVRSYARLLGLNADELVQVAELELREGDDPSEFHDFSSDSFDQCVDVSSGKRSWPSILLLIILVAAIGYVVWYFQLRPEALHQAAEPEHAQVVEVPEAPAAEAVESAVSAPAVVPARPEAAEPGQEEQAVTPAAAPAVEPEAAEADQQAVVAEDDRPLAPGEHLVVVTAKSGQECWVGVWGDEGEDLRGNFIVKPDNPLRLRFRGTRRVRFGNVAGVEVRFDGQDFALDGGDTNIQTVRFP